MVSLVILLRESVHLDMLSSREKLKSVFPGAFYPENDDSFVIEGSNPLQLFVKSVIPANSGIFLVNFVPASYTEFSGFLSHIADPGLKAWVTDHRAWLSIDRIGEIGTDDDSYRFIGKALAKLAPVDAIAVVHPERYITVAFRHETRDQLRSDDVLVCLGMQMA